MKKIFLPKVGDVLIILLLSGLIGLHVYRTIFCRPSSPDTLVIHRTGAADSQFRLPIKKTIKIQGAIGETYIEIDHYRARVTKDPGPKQICVEQGWITAPGDTLICAPSEIIIQLRGREKNYDSTTY